MLSSNNNTNYILTKHTGSKVTKQVPGHQQPSHRVNCGIAVSWIKLHNTAIVLQTTNKLCMSEVGKLVTCRFLCYCLVHIFTSTQWRPYHTFPDVVSIQLSSITRGHWFSCCKVCWIEMSSFMSFKKYFIMPSPSIRNANTFNITTNYFEATQYNT